MHKSNTYALFQSGLEVGEMILAVNKDSLLGANYDTVSVSTISYIFNLD